MDLCDYQPNEFAGLVITECLATLGVCNVVISPGSRSTPYTFAFATDPRFESHVVLDERSAGFFALGIAKRTSLPVVLLCTSGSACANYLPAIVEAKYSQTPLIVLTTDRPVDQWECHAGQTIKQSGIFNAFTNWETELAEPQSSIKYLKYFRETLKHAFYRSQFPKKGVVHLNAPLEQPLTPELNQEQRGLLRKFISTRVAHTLVFNETSTASASAGIKDIFLGSKRILIIVGQNYFPSNAKEVAHLLRFQSDLEAPILADALNPMRNVDNPKAKIIKNYDFIVRTDAIATYLRPDLILQCGNLPTGKMLRERLEQWDSPIIQIGQSSENQDPSNSNKIAHATFSTLWQSIEACDDSRDDRYLSEWCKLDQTMDEHLHSSMKAIDKFSEPILCSQLSGIISNEIDLFVSNSMIVRDMDVFWAGNEHVKRVYSNRGANGIDGITSTAFGLVSSERPLVCLIGDLAFLHDASGLNLLRQLSPDQQLIFVLLDNEGGGIFEHLPIAKINPPFETFFSTPQQVDIPQLCGAYSIDYYQGDSFVPFAEYLQSHLSSSSGQTLCLHLKFDRKDSYRVRKSLAQSAIKTLENYEYPVDQN